jgi:FSR family fosmidomycin resistance protein-like MFS transporter
MVSLALSVPLLLLAMLSPAPLSYALLAVGGTFLNVGVPVNVVMAQRLVPGGASTVSALMMGFAWGAGALCAPLVGLLSSSIGFARALTMVTFLPLFAMLFLSRFPKDERQLERMELPASMLNAGTETPQSELTAKLTL